MNSCVGGLHCRRRSGGEFAGLSRAGALIVPVEAHLEWVVLRLACDLCSAAAGRAERRGCGVVHQADVGFRVESAEVGRGVDVEDVFVLDTRLLPVRQAHAVDELEGHVPVAPVVTTDVDGDGQQRVQLLANVRPALVDDRDEGEQKYLHDVVEALDGTLPRSEGPRLGGASAHCPAEGARRGAGDEDDVLVGYGARSVVGIRAEEVCDGVMLLTFAGLLDGGLREQAQRGDAEGRRRKGGQRGEDVVVEVLPLLWARRGRRGGGAPSGPAQPAEIGDGGHRRHIFTGAGGAGYDHQGVTLASGALAVGLVVLVGGRDVGGAVLLVV